MTSTAAAMHPTNLFPHQENQMRGLVWKHIVLAVAVAAGLGASATQAHAQAKTINWSLLSQDSFNPNRPGCHEYIHKEFLQAGVTYVIQMKSSQFDTYLFLENLNGQVLAQNDDDGFSKNSKIVYTPNVSGDYNLVCTSFNQGATGAYQLMIVPQNPLNPPPVNPPFNPPPVNPPPVNPPAGAMTLNKNWSLLAQDSFNPHRPGCHEQLHQVFLQAGVTYRIEMFSSQFDAYLYLENQNGQVLAQDDDSAGNKNARIFFTPSVSGTYTVVCTSFNQGATGAYLVRVSP